MVISNADTVWPSSTTGLPGMVGPVDADFVAALEVVVVVEPDAVAGCVLGFSPLGLQMLTFPGTISHCEYRF